MASKWGRGRPRINTGSFLAAVLQYIYSLQVCYFSYAEMRTGAWRATGDEQWERGRPLTNVP